MLIKKLSFAFRQLCFLSIHFLSTTKWRQGWQKAQADHSALGTEVLHSQLNTNNGTVAAFLHRPGESMVWTERTLPSMSSLKFFSSVGAVIASFDEHSVQWREKKMSCYVCKGKEKKLLGSRFSNKMFWQYCLCMDHHCLDFLCEQQKVAYKL